MSTNNEFKTDVAKMRSLMERMEKPHTHAQALLSESKMIEEATAPTRQLKSAREIIDILDKIGVNKFVSFGYVSGAKMDTPIKRKNPATNKQKSYPDWEGLAQTTGTEGEISGLVKIASYNIRYNNASSISKKYGKFVDDTNAIRAKYGLPPMAHKTYTTNMNYGNGGVKSYDGENEDLKGNLYSAQDIFNCKVKSKYYPIDTQGHIIGVLEKSQVKNYLAKSSSSISGVKQLRDMNTEDAKIQAYIEELGGLNFKYMSFLFDKILYIAATVDGQKIVYINDNLSCKVEGIDINPQEFIQIAKDRYAESLQEIEQEGMSQTGSKM
jgi:hypothetical protein